MSRNNGDVPRGFDENGLPTKIPPSARAALWQGKFELLERIPQIYNSLMDQAIQGSRKCPHCNESIEWHGDVKAGLGLLSHFEKMVDMLSRADPGALKEGDLGALAEKLSAQELADLIVLVRTKLQD